MKKNYVLLFTLFLGFLISSKANAQVNFGTPQQISTVGVTSVTTSGPQVAEDALGNAVAAWLDTISGTTYVGVSVFNRFEGWGSVTYVGSNTSVSNIGVACTEAGQAIIAWIDLTAG